MKKTLISALALLFLLNLLSHPGYASAKKRKKNVTKNKTPNKTPVVELASDTVFNLSPVYTTNNGDSIITITKKIEIKFLSDYSKDNSTVHFTVCRTMGADNIPILVDSLFNIPESTWKKNTTSFIELTFKFYSIKDILTYEVENKIIIKNQPNHSITIRYLDERDTVPAPPEVEIAKSTTDTGAILTNGTFCIKKFYSDSRVDTIYKIPITLKFVKPYNASFNKIKFKLDTGTLANHPSLDVAELTIPQERWIDTTPWETFIYLKATNSDTLKQGWGYYHGKISICDQPDDECVFLKQVPGNIAQSRLQIFAAAYTTPTTIKSDDPSLTQTYLRFNIPIRETEGIDYNRGYLHRFIFFRNIFTQLTYTTNASNANYLDNTNFSTATNTNFYYPPLDSPGSTRHINRLDLLENANFNLNITLPVLTYIIPQYKNHEGDFAHVYLEPFCSFLNTTVSKGGDTTAGPVSVHSIEYGLDLGLRTESMVIAGVPLFVELTGKIFCINPMSGTVVPDLNYQYSRINDYNTNYPGKHLLDPSNHPYYNFDALVIYNTNRFDADKSSNAFAHFSYTTNIVRPTSSNMGHVPNNFLQIQIGYALNLKTFISQVQSGNSGSSSTSTGQ